MLGGGYLQNVKQKNERQYILLCEWTYLAGPA
jgi:hypothetical protein